MLVNDLGRFVAATRYDALPHEVIDAVKLRLLDVFGAGLVGVQLGAHRSLLAILGGACEATPWGARRKIALRDTVIVNAFLAHAAYLEDGSRQTGGHPASAVIPSACAYAEHRHACGRDLIAAVAAGYEVFLRLGRAIYPETVNRGFQSTAVLAAVSSAAACSNLQRFSAETAKNALAIACSLGVGLKEALKSSASQPLQVGRSAEGGVVATLYAAQGAQGADGIIEKGFLPAFGGDAGVSRIAAGLGTQFQIFDTYFKVHGGCRGNHAPVDVTLALARAHRIAADAIERVQVWVDTVTYAAEIHAPRDGNEAQFSVAFAVAVALLEGNASIFQYTDAQAGAPKVRALMARIAVAVDRSLDDGYPDKRGAIVEVTLTSGAGYRGRTENARGEPEDPLSAAEVEQKFLTLAAATLGKARAARLRDAVMRMEAHEDTAGLAALLAVRRRAGDARQPHTG